MTQHCCYCISHFPQTVEKWTLHDIQAQFRAGGGGAPANLLHPPPPIPARRNIASQQGQANQTRPTTQQNTEPTRRESQSAPSSPTEMTRKSNDQDIDARDELTSSDNQQTLHGHAPSMGRPRSVLVDDGTLKYSTIAFVSDDEQPTPPARRNTKYSNIKHVIKNVSTSTEGVDRGDTRSVSPSYVSMAVCPRVQVMENSSSTTSPPNQNTELEYDVPPPPVPVRFGNQESVHDMMLNTEPAPDDPFSHTVDPFSAKSTWNDPLAFYDKPCPLLDEATPATSTKEDGYTEIHRDDFTGESSYEDTSSFLKDIRARYKDKLAHEGMGLLSSQSQHKKVDDDEEEYSLPPVEVGENSQSPPTTSEDTMFGNYDYPSALSRYPFKDNEGVGGDKSKEEPPLHTIHFSVQKQQSGGSIGGTGGSAVLRSESFAGRGSRANLPLPPTPLDHDLKGYSDLGGKGDPPPLPARQGGGPAPLKQHSSRDGSLHPTPANDRPRLPPFNHPWGNRRQLSNQPPSVTSYEHQNPPLPPRKKPQGNPNSHCHGDGGEGGRVTMSSPPVPHHQEDPGMLELINRGYQHADIESALRIAKNDYELAKNILKEFGGRH